MRHADKLQIVSAEQQPAEGCLVKKIASKSEQILENNQFVAVELHDVRSLHRLLQNFGCEELLPQIDVKHSKRGFTGCFHKFEDRGSRLFRPLRKRSKADRVRRLGKGFPDVSPLHEIPSHFLSDLIARLTAGIDLDFYCPGRMCGISLQQ